MSKPMNINFTIHAPMPIDSRMMVESFADLDAIAIKYDHMVSHVRDEDQDYRYHAEVPEWLPLSITTSVSWGDIIGTITDQIDLMNEFAKYALVNHTHPADPLPTHTHIESEITDLDKYTKAEVDALLVDTNLFDTGITAFGELSINADPTKFDVALGAGIKQTWAPSTPFAPPVLEMVDFGPFTEITPQFLATDPVSYIAIDFTSSVASVVQSSVPFTNTSVRDVIEIGAIVHPNNTDIQMVRNHGAPIVNISNQLGDLFAAIGGINVEGNVYAAVGGDMTVTRSEGTLVKYGMNQYANYKNPHENVLSQDVEVLFKYALQDSTLGTSTTTVVTNLIDVAGTPTAITPGKWSIQRWYLYADGETKVQYGQAEYDTKEDAITAMETEPFVVESDNKYNGTLRGYLVIQDGATDLADLDEAEFFEEAKFGGPLGSSFAITYDAVINALGFVPEDVANKATDFSVLNNILYPTTLAVNTLVEANKDKDYVHVQGAASTTWVIPHGFGRTPSIVAKDNDGNRHFGDEVDTDLNTTTITFLVAIAGVAHCN